jgi:hypothetical protein
MRHGLIALALVALALGGCGDSVQEGAPTATPLTLRLPHAPARGPEGDQEITPLLETKFCGGISPEPGHHFRLSVKLRSQHSWTVIVVCADGSRHTVSVTWPD